MRQHSNFQSLPYSSFSAATSIFAQVFCTTIPFFFLFLSYLQTSPRRSATPKKHAGSSSQAALFAFLTSYLSPAHPPDIYPVPSVHPQIAFTSLLRCNKLVFLIRLRIPKRSVFENSLLLRNPFTLQGSTRHGGIKVLLRLFQKHSSLESSLLT